MRKALLLVAVVVICGSVRPAEAARVAVFGDPSFIDPTPADQGGEFEAIKASLGGLGHTVQGFTGTSFAAWKAVLDTSEVLVIPEQENGDLNPALSDTARAVIAAFVLRGHGLIACGDGSGRVATLLNALFGFNVGLTGSSLSGSAALLAGAVGTAFESGPANLVIADETTTLNTLPPGSIDLYDFGGGSVAFTTTVGTTGRVTYLGYDWFALGAPNPADWVQVLGKAVTQSVGAVGKHLAIAMFQDPGFVDDTEEGPRMNAAMTSMGHNVVVFSGTADPVWSAALFSADVLVVPELERGDLFAALPTATRAAIRKFVLGGGGILVNEDFSFRANALLNGLFGYALTSGPSFLLSSLNPGAAAGTPFAGGPANLPAPSLTESVPTASLPAGSLNLYVNGANNVVFAVDRGLGHIAHLGFDWFSTDVPYVPWLSVLNCGLAYCAQPVLLAPNAPAQPPGTNAPVTVNINAAKFITGQTLRFRAGGDPAFASLPLVGPPNAVAATIPGTSLTNKGVQYYVELNDGIGVGTFPRNAPRITSNLPVTLTNQALFSLPGAASYTLAGVPIAAADPSPTAIFDELGGYDVTKWRYGTFDGAAYHEPGGGAANATPGQGFWIIAKSAAGIAASGTSTNVSGPILVTLKHGFNQIADPFEFPVDFADVVLPANVQNNLIGFNGSSYLPGQTILLPGQGYWIKNDNAGSVVIAIPPLGSGVAPPVPHASLTATDGWSLQVNAHAGRFADVGNVLGMKSGALEGRDAFDLSDPPVPPGGWVRLGFAEPAEDDLLADWRPRNSSGATWDVIFASDQAGESFHIDLTPTVALPAGWGIAAFDANREIDLGGTGSITGVVGASTAPRTYTVSVGSAEYLGGIRAQALSTVTSFALAAPFPNPSSGRIAVDLALPRAEHDVRVEVFDANGRLVRTVASGSFEAGVHRIEWDGRATGGDRAGAGLYFLRARAGAQTANRKVALIP